MSEEREVGLPGAGAPERDAPDPSGQDAPRASSTQSKPTAQELKEILARHRGWLANQQGGEPLPRRRPLPGRSLNRRTQIGWMKHAVTRSGHTSAVLTCPARPSWRGPELFSTEVRAAFRTLRASSAT